jgi:hypothetical protein
MLDDPRADTLVSNFAGQWLHLRNVDTVKPDPVIFPFDEALRSRSSPKRRSSSRASSARSQPARPAVGRLHLRQPAPGRALRHPRVYGSQFRRVTLTDVNRRGCSATGSVLTVTSYPNRTSVVQRGKWILENLLGRRRRRRPPMCRS